MKETRTLSVKTFTDYRAFLLAHAQDSKVAKSGWSYGLWARKLGLKTTSSLTKIIQGQREPGPQMVEKFVQYFKFSNAQAEYFRDLVSLHKIKSDPRLSVLLMEKMGKEHPDGRIQILDDKRFSLISQWYCLAVREMVRLEGFFDDPDWISSRFHFKVTPREVSGALKLLFDLKLIYRDEDGNVRLSEGRVHTTNDISSEAIKRYHEKMLELAKLAIRDFQPEIREFTSATLSVKRENIQEAKELIREFRNKFSRILECDGGDDLYQLQVQFFPLTEQKKGRVLQ